MKKILLLLLMIWGVSGVCDTLVKTVNMTALMWYDIDPPLTGEFRVVLVSGETTKVNCWSDDGKWLKAFDTPFTRTNWFKIAANGYDPVEFPIIMEIWAVDDTPDELEITSELALTVNVGDIINYTITASGGVPAIEKWSSNRPSWLNANSTFTLNGTVPDALTTYIVYLYAKDSEETLVVEELIITVINGVPDEPDDPWDPEDPDPPDDPPVDPDPNEVDNDDDVPTLEWIGEWTIKTSSEVTKFRNQNYDQMLTQNKEINKFRNKTSTQLDSQLSKMDSVISILNDINSNMAVEGTGGNFSGNVQKPVIEVPEMILPELDDQVFVEESLNKFKMPFSDDFISQLEDLKNTSAGSNYYIYLPMSKIPFCELDDIPISFTEEGTVINDIRIFVRDCISCFVYVFGAMWLMSIIVKVVS